MNDASIIGNTNLEIADVEMFALLGQKDCEIFMKDKAIERLNGQFDKIRSALVELEVAKKRVAELEESNRVLTESNNQVAPLIDKSTNLETSNKSLSDMNIKLDTALTEERQKVKIYSSRIAELDRSLKDKDEDISKLVESNQSISIELDTLRLELMQKDVEIGELKNVEYNKGKKGNGRRSTNT
jgi:chromosome segregation ATPase